MTVLEVITVSVLTFNFIILFGLGYLIYSHKNPPNINDSQAFPRSIKVNKSKLRTPKAPDPLKIERDQLEHRERPMV